MVPNVVIGLLLLLGALAVSRHELTLGGLVAFVTLTLLLVWPIEAMGFIIATGQEAATAAQRIYEIFDTPPAVTSRPGVTEVRALVPAQAQAQVAAATGPRGPASAGVTGTWSSTRSPSATRRRPRRCCAASAWSWRPARPSRWSAPPARARPRCCTWCRGWPT